MFIGHLLFASHPARPWEHDCPHPSPIHFQHICAQTDTPNTWRWISNSAESNLQYLPVVFHGPGGRRLGCSSCSAITTDLSKSGNPASKDPKLWPEAVPPWVRFCVTMGTSALAPFPKSTALSSKPGFCSHPALPHRCYSLCASVCHIGGFKNSTVNLKRINPQ